MLLNVSLIYVHLRPHVTARLLTLSVDFLCKAVLQLTLISPLLITRRRLGNRIIPAVKADLDPASTGTPHGDERMTKLTSYRHSRAASGQSSSSAK